MNNPYLVLLGKQPKIFGTCPHTLFVRKTDKTQINNA